MTTIRNVGHYGVIATGAVALFVAAMVFAKLAADLVIFLGQLVMT